MTPDGFGDFSQKDDVKYINLEQVLGFEKIIETVENLGGTTPSGTILYNLGFKEIKLSYNPDTIAKKPLIVEEVGMSRSALNLDIFVKVRNYSTHIGKGLSGFVGTSDYNAEIRFAEYKPTVKKSKLGKTSIGIIF